MKFKQFIEEKFFEGVSDSSDYVEIFKNPNNNEFNSLKKKNNYDFVARGVIIQKTGDLYIWDVNVLHYDIIAHSNKLFQLCGGNIWDLKHNFPVKITKNGNIELAIEEGDEDEVPEIVNQARKTLEELKNKVNVKNSICKINGNGNEKIKQENKSKEKLHKGILYYFKIENKIEHGIYTGITKYGKYGMKQSTNIKYIKRNQILDI